MSRKAETFFDAITLLREDLVEEAQNCVFRKRRTGWRRFGSLAACLVLIVSLGLLALPKGCGGAAPPQLNSSGGSDFCAPAEAPEGGDTDAPSDTADPAPAPEPSGEAPPGAEEQLRFTARVLEVLEDGLLAEPLEGLPAELETVFVPTAGLEELPAFEPGSVVTVTCGAVAQEGGEAEAKGVTAVWLAEPGTTQ